MCLSHCFIYLNPLNTRQTPCHNRFESHSKPAMACSCLCCINVSADFFVLPFYTVFVTVFKWVSF